VGISGEWGVIVAGAGEQRTGTEQRVEKEAGKRRVPIVV